MTRRRDRTDRPDPEIWARPRRDRTETARRTIYGSHNGGWRVVISRSLFGLPSRVYAIRRVAGGEVILSTHRQLCPALRACERDMRLRLSKVRLFR